MFEKNAYVMHKSEGVCVVEDIRTEHFPGSPAKRYYILRPLYENTSTTVFLPLESADKRLRPLLTKGEIAQLLGRASGAPPLWEKNDRQRQEKFNHLLKEGEPLAMLCLIGELRQHRAGLTAVGKKLRFFDEHILQECERLVAQEFAYVWQIDRETALSRILRSENI